MDTPMLLKQYWNQAQPIQKLSSMRMMIDPMRKTRPDMQQGITAYPSRISAKIKMARKMVKDYKKQMAWIRTSVFLCLMISLTSSNSSRLFIWNIKLFIIQTLLGTHFDYYLIRFFCRVYYNQQMKVLFLLIAVAFCLDLPSQYHTTEQINQELEDLRSKCSFIEVSDALESPVIKQIDINRGANKKYKGFVVFGEHAREMISPETGLHYVKELCRNYMSGRNKKVLENYELRMIVNANPVSRAKVEKGEYCIRENENGVDINRNYDAHWKENHDNNGQTDSGPEPFSEPETRAIRDSLKSFGANIFLSVHSGVLGMFTPHAYSLEDAEVNDDKMVDILDNLQNNHCPTCEVGSAGQAIGYLSPGSCIDYAYDELGIKYSFAFEIYSGNDDLQEELRESQQQQASFLQVQSSAKQRKQRIREKLSRNSSVGSCFLQTATKTNTQMEDEMCFHYFNPQDQADYDFYVSNWSDAISDMFIDMIEEEATQ